MMCCISGEEDCNFCAHLGGVFSSDIPCQEMPAGLPYMDYIESRTFELSCLSGYF